MHKLYEDNRKYLHFFNVEINIYLYKCNNGNIVLDMKVEIL